MSLADDIRAEKDALNVQFDATDADFAACAPKRLLTETQFANWDAFRRSWKRFFEQDESIGTFGADSEQLKDFTLKLSEWQQALQTAGCKLSGPVTKPPEPSGALTLLDKLKPLAIAGAVVAVAGLGVYALVELTPLFKVKKKV